MDRDDQGRRRSTCRARSPASSRSTSSSLHGWDIARASGQDYECDQESLEAAYGFVAPFSAPGMEAQREGLFGPVVDVADDAPLLDRLLGLAGRDPSWTPS